MAGINFFNEDIVFKLKSPLRTANWIKTAVKLERSKVSTLNYIFCSDLFLLSLNKKYLNHNTLTDIVTFDLSGKGEESALCGEIYISVDRVRENASLFEVPFDEELHRVIIHGVLHLIGYTDKKSSEKLLMRKKEEAYLSLRKN